jgi:DNA mismatch endonuclease (patch repair protein)
MIRRMTERLPYRTPIEVFQPAATAAARSAEQDAAAGGRARRRVTFQDGGEATASVGLRRMTVQRRAYAYLRFRYQGRNYGLYIGDASAPTREEALRNAWQQARKKGMTRRPLPTRS